MNAAAYMSTLIPLLPEIVLGLGAMALLMLGAFAPTHPSPASGGGLGWGPASSTAWRSRSWSRPA